MHIIIPTAGRSETIVTHDLIPPRLRPHTVIVTPPGERKAYEAKTGHTGIRVRVCEFERLSPKFDWCINRYASPEDPYIFFPNDDIKLAYRADPDSTKLTPITTMDERERMWGALLAAIEDFAWVGVSNRSGNNHVPAPYKDVTRSYGFWGVDARVLWKYNLKFGCIESMQDFWMQLALFTRGHPNRVFYRWCWDQIGGSNSAGGCSAYRTPEMQERSVAKLVLDYPHVVTAVQRTTKGGWFNGKPRTDVRVQWQKAYRNSLDPK